MKKFYIRTEVIKDTCFSCPNATYDRQLAGMDCRASSTPRRIAADDVLNRYARLSMAEARNTTDPMAIPEWCPLEDCNEEGDGSDFC